ncbi:uncharacterized protein LOC18434601 [Amborella trichopoda]|uniref:SWIM-type domain-containing protein n=1 Tax=Amborella trichopoda TaxID=13333 RepID=W1P943_AMBTC|nr:uncharacterized protein LOC18434601 [Amborella trichopoda]XP_020523007.1 uncharacterized protein LOC18434601 [Amborella trichopoda]XP_020523008.1 uncharacterized protein LOC18434601 [Amborella trichopoda]XP_020523009.1 uncharacterized protein LOC18434601 [Amborella trichopoda]XP_020523010.1 uncharacterized protein LOC18434601 [Amborella trichopoda]ERN06407.1 hypothetical protein AMTR_s00016p00254170 [Amborella trichopoda]|eukprot:XP_006844732.1 uncharacterized protein LOC18434601 [Amborella trichopoda]
MALTTHNSLSIGQEFADVESCRKALKETALALHFDLRIVKSDRCRFTAKCAKKGCPWRVHIAKLPGVSTFTVRTLHGEHTCGGVGNLRHQQASVGWVANSVEQKLRDNPQYKPKDILQDIRQEHGITVSYLQAWRGKERSMAAVHGSFEEGYRLLPLYCEQIRRTNPGSFALVITGQENRFQRLYISYRASIYGFVNACRPLLELDRIHVKSKYLGTLLCAAAVDADGSPFPLAFGIVDTENHENWLWFLSELRKMLGMNTENMPRLTILSNREMGIVDAVEVNFPTSFHGFCLRYLSDNFRKEFRNTKLVNIFWNAAYALTTMEFDAKIVEMAEISQDTVQWMQNYPPRLWSVAYFEGARYGHLSLSITEQLNNWITEARELPIIQMMECIRSHLTTWFNERREKGLQWTSILVPSAEKRMAEAIADSRCYQVLRANEVEFEIVSTERTNIVDIRSRSCSCRRWQLFGLPCAHATAALLSCGQDAHRFAEGCFTVVSYLEAYSQPINPIPDRNLWKELMEGGEGGGSLHIDMNVRPPKTRRPRGRPRKSLIRTEETRIKRIMHCGRCNQIGHSKKTCKTPMLPLIDN